MNNQLSARCLSPGSPSKPSVSLGQSPPVCRKGLSGVTGCETTGLLLPGDDCSASGDRVARTRLRQPALPGPAQDAAGFRLSLRTRLGAPVKPGCRHFCGGRLCGLCTRSFRLPFCLNGKQTSRGDWKTRDGNPPSASAAALAQPRRGPIPRGTRTGQRLTRERVWSDCVCLDHHIPASSGE